MSSTAAPGAARPRRLRLVRQLEVGDCGAACLATVLRSYGHDVALADLRDLTSTGRDGVSAAGLLAAARHFGFDGEGVRCPPERLGELPRGSVLHWNRNHFVVLDGVTRRGLRVVDPALGHRVVPPETVRAAYSGVAVLLRPVAAAPRPALARPGPRARAAPYRPFVRGSGRVALLALLCAIAVQVFALVHPLTIRLVVDRLAAGGAEPSLGGGLSRSASARSPWASSPRARGGCCSSSRCNAWSTSGSRSGCSTTWWRCRTRFSPAGPPATSPCGCAARSSSGRS
jgi:predicted double-glycine peptidase